MLVDLLLQQERVAETLGLRGRQQQMLLEAHALAALGDIWRAQGQLDSAALCFEQSLALRQAIGDQGGEGWMQHRLAETHAAMGTAADTRQAAAAGSALAAACGDEELARACGQLRIPGPVSPRKD
ncbi:MAG: tetratricopeptide repeat protein [Vicinamibacterales bacterium]